MIRYNLIDYGEYVYDKHREKEGYMADNEPRNIDILYTLDSASNYFAIQKLKPWLQTQDIPMKWEVSYVFYSSNRELKH
jgi:hypothetical protein